ncbi:ARM repeat-containing protein [Guyanagaster necrorhizus]|uniref:ARM repeat-containing protein n=1 Tax=Guyanagaster necrorhizus TaxID=856835 RepID=A0A9P7VZT8_9AGAR|nr:ARM repeat-containing protein [Guyanagaster necrorhizus MCA 3950]KAG7449785.1 ARM repeat-containing protein [Guyanagaster necrorhizus MCA 3950]
MDVPFISSGASSRRHFSLVRNVENAQSGQHADEYIFAEVRSIRSQFNDPGLSLRSCKELLIVLLYCYNAVTTSTLKQEALYFAIPHAINLAEAASNAKDKWIGYLFCSEIMPPNHELQLMLVNTLRKDLEGSSPTRICLALDNLIASSTEDVIPAVQARLQDLLVHYSPHIRRRALLAYRALSRHDTDLIKRIIPTVMKRMKDRDPSVSGSAIAISTSIPDNRDIQKLINELFSSASTIGHPESRYWLLTIIRTLRNLGMNDTSLPNVIRLIRSASTSKDYGLLREAALLLREIRKEAFLNIAMSSRRALVESIREMLVSREPNEQYLFLSCLDCVDPMWWAGTSPECPAVLEEWEVERFMQLLDSADPLIRQKAVKVLNNVDPDVILAYYAQSLQALPAEMPYNNKMEFTWRLLEVLQVQFGGDGERYACQVLELFRRVESVGPSDSQRVLDAAVEKVLSFIRDGISMFQIASSTVFLARLAEGEDMGPTMMVIVAALGCEYCGQLSLPPKDLLSALSSRLASSAASVQDACLLSMLRISAECEAVPEGVKLAVSGLAETARRYIRHRCEQFLKLSAQRDVLMSILHSARSPTLPHVLQALMQQSSKSSLASPPLSPRKSSASLSPIASPSLGASKLRYDAYERPTSIPRLRDRQPSSTRSESTSNPLPALLKTVTAGDLALAAQEFEMMSLSSLQPTDHGARPDLIAFDTPFISDPSSADFEITWNTLGPSTSAQGWFEGSVDVLLDRLKTLEGSEMKVIPADEVKVSLKPSEAVLRLRANEDDGCLWRLRCGDAQLRIRIKRALAE